MHIKANRYLSIIPDDLSYFQHCFVGRPMSTDWKAPPITISGHSKRLPDVVSWMVQAPIVSERAKRFLSDAIADFAQLLPFHKLKGKRYYALNVTHVETSIVNETKSGIRYRDAARKEPMSLDRVEFEVRSSYKLPPIFKVALPEGPVFSDIYVTQPFVILRSIID